MMSWREVLNRQGGPNQWTMNNAGLLKILDGEHAETTALIVRWLKYGEISGGTRMDAEGFADEIEAEKHLQPILCRECEKTMCDGDEAFDGALHAECARAIFKHECVMETFAWGKE